MRKELGVLLGLGAVLATTVGCTEEEEPIDLGLIPTAVSVDPQYFLGDVPCAPSEGAMRSFVATFVDNGPEVAGQPWDTFAPGFPFLLPSSPPTPCTEIASYRYVVLGHRYWAFVDGYEQSATTLRPAGLNCDVKSASGSRHVCEQDEDGNLTPVEPRWTTTCGVGERQQAVAANNTDKKITECLQLDDGGTPGPTSILVDPNVALGSLTCIDDEVGDVGVFSIVPDDVALPEVTGIPCGATPSPYSEDIEPGASYTFRVEARAEEDGPVLWAASCFSIPTEGIVNNATCDPLTDRGTLAIELTDGCAAGDTVDVAVSFGPQTGELASFDCEDVDTELLVPGVLAGDYAIVEVTVRPADGDPTALTCTAAKVPPAGVGTSICTPP